MADIIAPKSSLGLLGKLGVNITTEIAGAEVANAHETPIPNMWQLDLADGRKVFAGKKSFDEGLLVEKGDKIFIADGFEIYNNQGKMMIRNKARQNNLANLQVV